MLLKPVADLQRRRSPPRRSSQLNGSETFTAGPAGKGVNWLVDPPLIPGQGVYLGEGYTGNPGGKKYIDIVRTVDNVNFRLKARLIRSIGNVRISRSGLRALVGQMEAVLEPLVRHGVIEGYKIVIPVLTCSTRTRRTHAAEDQQINNAQSERVVEVLVAVDYAGAIHRIAHHAQVRIGGQPWPTGIPVSRSSSATRPSRRSRASRRPSTCRTP